MKMGRSANWDINEVRIGINHDKWQKRIEVMASYLSDKDKSIVDFGAGNMYLKSLLSEDKEYYPVDYIKRSPETIVCDLNKKEFPKREADVAFCSGILGYLDDVEWFLDALCKNYKKLILSYIGEDVSKEIIEFLAQKGFIITARSYSLPRWSLIACFEHYDKVSNKMFECTGCGACANICSHDAIEMRINENGFFSPFIIEEKCISCGKCTTVCHVFQRRKKGHRDEASVVCYAAWASDKIREVSSSGGVYTVFANQMISEKGTVYGAVLNLLQGCCEIKRMTELEDIAPSRHSKYVQSYTAKSFSEVRIDLQEGNRVLYTGLPCQLAGLRRYLQIYNVKQSNLITVDLLCAYAPPVKAFKKYFEENWSDKEVQELVFRAKQVTGWSFAGYEVKMLDGTSIFPNWTKDDYTLGFHCYLMRRDICEHCRFAEIPREGDITIGDFWGIEEKEASWNDKLGTSVVLLNSEKGEHFFNRCNSALKRSERVPVSWLINTNNRVGKSGIRGHNNRIAFFSMMKEGYTFHDCVHKSLEYEDKASFWRNQQFILKQFSNNLEEKDVVIACFGAGNHFKETYGWIRKYHMIQFLTDNNFDLWGSEICGVSCVPPKDLCSIENLLVIITTISPGVSVNIMNQLLEMGITRIEHIDNWIEAIKCF